MKHKFILAGLIMCVVILNPIIQVRGYDIASIAEELIRLDTTLKVADSEEDILVLNDTLVDHVLPSLTPVEILRNSSTLKIPTDLLQVAQSLFLRLTLYPHTECLVVRSNNGKNFSFLIVAFGKDGQQINKIIDRRDLFRGTWSILKKMNLRFPKESEHVSFSRLQASFNNPETIAEIEAGIKRQRASNVAELGGFMTIEDSEKKPPRLHLYFVQTEGEEFIKVFRENIDDWKKLVALMRQNPVEFAFLPYQYRSCLKTMELAIPEEKKKERVLAFADLFLFMAQNTYCPDAVRYFRLLSGNMVKGKFVGDFHIHPLENEVSFQDKENSSHQRVLVIIPRRKGFDLVDLKNVSPSTQPEKVILYRPKK